MFSLLYIHPQFGGQLKEVHKQRYGNSQNWDGKKFENLTETNMNIQPRDIPGLLKRQLFDKKGREPQKPLPIIPLEEHLFAKDDDGKPKFIWYGHSVILMRIGGKNILIDPMLGSDAAPIAPFGVKRFSQETLSIIDRLPLLDAILISHDHYDHLDYASIQKLKEKTSSWIVALGVGRHLERWGIPEQQIQEMDWWDELSLGDIKVAFTPSRHFSGRGITDRAQSLWGGFVLISGEHRLYWSGDGGYGKHFEEVGEKYGPFQWGFMECGQYNELWHQIHMFPEESVQAGIEAKANILIPIHWAGFALALHTWQEPVQRFAQEAIKQKIQYISPRLGEIVRLGEENRVQSDWWKGFK